MRYPEIFNASPCNTQDQFEQIKQLSYNLDLSECASLCPYECFTEDYSLSISYTDYPSWDYYYQAVNTRSDFYNALFNTTDISEITYDMFKASSASLFLYYDDLVDTQITESPSLTSITLISNVGGILGLFIGVSILSFVEFIELAIEFLIIVRDDRREKRLERKLEEKNNGNYNGKDKSSTKGSSPPAYEQKIEMA